MAVLHHPKRVGAVVCMGVDHVVELPVVPNLPEFVVPVYIIIARLRILLMKFEKNLQTFDKEILSLQRFFRTMNPPLILK